MDQTGMAEKPVEDAQRLHGTQRVEGLLMTLALRLEGCRSVPQISDVAPDEVDLLVRIVDPGVDVLQSAVHGFDIAVPWWCSRRSNCRLMLVHSNRAISPCRLTIPVVTIDATGATASYRARPGHRPRVGIGSRKRPRQDERWMRSVFG